MERATTCHHSSAVTAPRYVYRVAMRYAILMPLTPVSLMALFRHCFFRYAADYCRHAAAYYFRHITIIANNHAAANVDQSTLTNVNQNINTNRTNE